MQIISNINEVVRYYSENKHSVTLRFADDDTINLKEEELDEDKNIEDIFDRYYTKFSLENNDDDQIEITIKDHSLSPPVSPAEEYTQMTENQCDLQDIKTNDIKNSSNNPELSNKLFFEAEKNKIIYSCYYCDYTTT